MIWIFIKPLNKNLSIAYWHDLVTQVSSFFLNFGMEFSTNHSIWLKRTGRQWLLPDFIDKLLLPMAGWQSGYAADCNSVNAGSIPTSASNYSLFGSDPASTETALQRCPCCTQVLPHTPQRHHHRQIKQNVTHRHRNGLGLNRNNQQQCDRNHLQRCFHFA